MKVLLTGSNGFLGWHVRVRLRALTDHDVVAVHRENWSGLASFACAADAIVHVAGVNRASDDDVADGNISLAQDVANAARSSGRAPRIVFANSIHSGNGTPYGLGKSRASDILATAAAEMGSAYVDVQLPNIFGEHGRPRYNSFVATFIDAVLTGNVPQVDDRTVDLLHVQSAAQSLIDGLTTQDKQLFPAATPTTVQQVLDKLRAFEAVYASTGDIPPLNSDLDVDLFNTLRAARFPHSYPISLMPRVDHRGRLVEVVRAHGGPGQTFASTTRPGISRGDHFHLRKIERFVVISGRARISLRKLFTDDLVSFTVTGDEPVAVDMPTMWAHNITNIGEDNLTTLFWTHDLFDPSAPDTFAESVLVGNGSP